MSDKPDCVLAVDPGRAKCGLAIVGRDMKIRARRVVPVAEVKTVVTHWCATHNISTVVIGDSTSSRQWRKNLAAWQPQAQILVVDESGSTLEARTLYWQFLPPRGWRRFVPLSLQTPPEPIDDFAAIVLARRFFASANPDAASTS